MNIFYKKMYIVCIIVSILLVFPGLYFNNKGQRWHLLYKDIKAGQSQERNNWLNQWQNVNGFDQLERYWNPVQKEWREVYNLNVDRNSFLKITNNPQNKRTIYPSDLINNIYNHGGNVEFVGSLFYTFAYLLLLGYTIFYIVQYINEYGVRPAIPTAIFFILAFPLAFLLVFSKKTGPGSAFARDQKRRNYYEAKRDYERSVERYEHAKNSSVSEYRNEELRSARKAQADALSRMIDNKE